MICGTQFLFGTYLRKTHSHKDSLAHEIFNGNGSYRLGRAIGDLFLFLGQAKAPAMHLQAKQ